MSPEPFVSRAKAPPAKRSEKGYGDENEPVRDVDVMMAGAKRIYILMIKINKGLLFFFAEFSKRNRTNVFRVSIEF